MKSLTQLRRDLKRTDAAIKQNVARQDFGYDLYVNDGGACLRRLQNEQNVLYQKRDKIVTDIVEASK